MVVLVVVEGLCRDCSSIVSGVALWLLSARCPEAGRGGGEWGVVGLNVYVCVCARCV